MRTLVFAVCAAALVAACDKKPESGPSTSATPEPMASVKPVASQAVKKDVTIDPAQLAPFPAITAKIESPANPITDEKVALGKMLYFDTRLSKSQEVSCNSCHDLAKFGVDGLKTSTGHKGQKGDRNAPTVYFAAGHIKQFWDGRAATVEEQALGPITNPGEMALKDEKQISVVLASIPGYAPLFKKAFPADKDPITPVNVAKAIGAFERTLVTTSRWDKFVGGDAGALTDDEKAGFNKFVEVGCQTCHQGAYFGGTQFEKLGKAKPWTGKTEDTGRMKVTKDEVDRLVFKVPSLRNIEKTAPYYHDGSVATLAEAIKLMGRHQLGKELSDADVASITTFLKALTGELHAPPKPELPPSGPNTPKGDPS
jgi:cytochrome c peroxidase